MIEERKHLEAILAEFEKFVGSPVHREYVAATTKDVEAVETRILEDDITSIPDIFTLLELRAQRRTLRAGISSFEDTVATLKSRIEQMKLAEQSTKRDTTTTDESNETDEPESESADA